VLIALLMRISDEHAKRTGEVPPRKKRSERKPAKADKPKVKEPVPV
jgi:hypothetical protein